MAIGGAVSDDPLIGNQQGTGPNPVVGSTFSTLGASFVSCLCLVSGKHTPEGIGRAAILSGHEMPVDVGCDPDLRQRFRDYIVA